ncbi:MAG: hypothetical protein RL021_683 [Bacteroidota bacterium]|jgi:O-antigen ligase
MQALHQRLENVTGKRPLLVIGLMMLAIGLPLSLFLTSISQFFLAGSFLLEGSIKGKFTRFLNNKPAVLLAGFWLLHVLGMAWTSDVGEGLKDLRIKLPLLLLPLIITGSGPVSRRQFRWVLGTFVTAVVVASCIHTFVLWTGQVTDIRDIHIFKISHIRFSLFCCLSIAICQWMAVSGGLAARSLHLVQLWIVAYLIITASATGLVILCVLATPYFLGWSVLNRRPVLFLATAATLIVACMAVWKPFSVAWRQMTERKAYTVPVHAYSAEGHYYYTDTSQTAYENGYPVWVEICDQELSRDWQKRSSIAYDSLDRLGRPIRSTLIHFLASKGLKKDAEALKTLSPDEIAGVENGISNVSMLKAAAINRRIKEIVWEIVDYRNGGDANGHSITQRLEYWKTALYLIGEHPFFGVGTGDMPDAFDSAYDRTDSRLLHKNRKRSHNQFLAITVAFGIAGLVGFLLLLTVGMIRDGIRHRNLLYIAFWSIAVLSMLSEDTLETQPGATFFALFFVLLSVPNSQTAAPRSDNTSS